MGSSECPKRAEKPVPPVSRSPNRDARCQATPTTATSQTSPKVPTPVPPHPTYPAETSAQNRVRDTPSKAVPPSTTSRSATSEGRRSSADAPTSGGRSTGRPVTGARPIGESRANSPNSTPNPSEQRAAPVPQRRATPKSTNV